MEVTAMNPGSPVSASSHGTVHITADNGYILYVNGERIGAGVPTLGRRKKYILEDALCP
jgi:hypothetical protein